LLGAFILIIKDGEFTELTGCDRQAFANALLNPVPLRDRAVNDARWYRQVMKGKYG
jgi:hypothetical protein